MTAPKDLITINANIEITATALQAIVENAKKIIGRNEKGVYRVDTAETVNQAITHFLLKQEFEEYVKNIDNIAEILKSP